MGIQAIPSDKLIVLSERQGLLISSFLRFFIKPPGILIYLVPFFDLAPKPSKLEFSDTAFLRELSMIILLNSLEFSKKSIQNFNSEGPLIALPVLY